MNPAKEIAFIDCGVPDLGTMLAFVRPDVETRLLSPAEPALPQLLRSLEGRTDIAAIHVIAHGRSGEVAFASGCWSEETLRQDADAKGELSKLGEALSPAGVLHVWSCRTGE